MTVDEAENFISLLEMKNVWELSQLANILKVKISEFQIFAESLPKSYGLSLSEDKLMITQNILNDISNHLMERFTSMNLMRCYVLMPAQAARYGAVPLVEGCPHLQLLRVRSTLDPLIIMCIVWMQIRAAKYGIIQQVDQ